MKRLYATLPSDNPRDGFISPTSVDNWRTGLRSAMPVRNQYQDTTWLLSSNIAYRLQYLEFLQALLLHHIESRVSKLHIIIEQNLIHQYCVTVNSVFEGLGSYFHRVAFLDRTGTVYPQERTVSEANWHGDLTRVTLEKLGRVQDRELRKDIREKIEFVTKARHRLHLDSMQIGERTDYAFFNQETYIAVFQTFKFIFAAMGNMPQNSNLFEEFPSVNPLVV